MGSFRAMYSWKECTNMIPVLTLFRTLLKNPVNGHVGYFWIPEHHGIKSRMSYPVVTQYSKLGEMDLTDAFQNHMLFQWGKCDPKTMVFEISCNINRENFTQL